MAADDQQERLQRRRELLEALGAVPCPDYQDGEEQTLVTFIGEARADPAEPYRVEEPGRATEPRS